MTSDHGHELLSVCAPLEYTSPILHTIEKAAIFAKKKLANHMQRNIKPIKHENNMQTFLFYSTEIHEPADSTFQIVLNTYTYISPPNSNAGGFSLIFS